MYGQSAHISWHPPIYPNGYIEQYEISWSKSKPVSSTSETAQVEVGSRLSKDRRSREAYMINVFEPMTYYNVKLSARNRVGPGRDWEKSLVAVSADDSKCVHSLMVDGLYSMTVKACFSLLLLTDCVGLLVM